MNKKGLSPVIASVLLVALVLVLAMIIYLWARAFIPETIEKSGETIENSCPRVVFDATYVIGSGDTDSLRVQNNGNVPIYGVRYGVERIGTLAYDDLIKTPIVAGGSVNFLFTTNRAASKENIRVTPILLGKASNGELKAFACGDESTKTYKIQ